MIYVNSVRVVAQDIEHAKESIAAVRMSASSLIRDSILIHNYSFLAEANSGRDDSLAQRYIDTLAQLKATTTWKKAEGLYYRAMGKYHDRRGEFEQALNAYSLAIESFERAGDQSDYLVYASILKAFVLSNNGLHENALDQLNAIRPLAEKLENKNSLAWIIDAYGDYYFYSSFGHQDINKALQYYLEVEAILPGVRSQSIVADNAHCLSGCYLRLGDEEKALLYRDKALQIAEQNGYKNIIFAVYGDLADVYEKRGNFAEAIKYRQLSLQYAQQANWIEMEARAENNIAYTYKAAGDFKNAFLHFEHLKEIEDSLSRFEVQERYAELQTKYESGKKDLEIERLKAHNLLLVRNVLVFLLLAGTGFLMYYTAVNKRLKKQNLALVRKQEEILAAHTEGQSLERRRMAAELHDNINAKIAATKWMLETLNSGQKSDEERHVIESLIQSMGEIYEDVRFISHNLVPKDIESKNLVELSTQLVDNLNQNQKIHFSTSSSGTPQILSNPLKFQIYGVIMELVNNIIKHSGCKNASIGIRYLNESIDISVKDDGMGFDSTIEHRGAGLKNVRARVDSVQGKMNINTNEQGTELEIHIPLSA